MSLYQLIRGLAKDRKVSISRIEKDVHIANGTLRKWDTSMPKAKNVQKVANYLGVTTDYLLNESNK